MNFLAFSGLANFISSAALAVLVYKKCPRRDVGIAYAVLNVTIASYSLFYFFWQCSSTARHGLFYLQLLTVSSMWTNPGLLYFNGVFFGWTALRRRVLYLALAGSILFSILNFTGTMYSNVTPRFGLGYWPLTVTGWFVSYICFWFCELLYAFSDMLSTRRQLQGHKRDQVSYMIVAFAVGYFGGSTNWPMWFGVHIPPYANILVSGYTMIVAYAMIKHHLMDINVIIRKTLIYSIVTAGLAAVYVGTMTLLVRMIEIHTPTTSLSTTVFTAALFGFRWIRTLLQAGFVYGCFAVSVMSIGLGVFVWLQGRKKAANRLWFIMCFCVAMWSTGLGMMVSSESARAAYLWQTWMLYAGASLIPTIYLHFVSVVIGRPIKRAIAGAYLFSILEMILNATGQLATVVPKAPFRFYTDALPAYYTYFVFFMVVATYAHILLAKKFYSSTGRVKEQIRYIVTGTVIGFIGGSTTFLYTFDIPVFPYGVYIVPVYTLTTSYAIYKHQLMDINVVIRRTLVYSVLSALLVCIYVTTITLLAHVLGAHKGSFSPFSSAVAAATITLLFNPLRVRLQRFVDRHFSRESVDQTVLREITGAFVHEIKTPLSNIALPAELTLMDMDDLQTGKAAPKDLIPKIKKRMKYIMDQALLAGSKVEAVREATVADSIARSTADLDQVIISSLKLMDSPLEQAHVEVFLDVPKSLRTIPGSAAQLEVVFGNLIKNAVEAMAEAADPRSLEIIVKELEKQVVVHVKDNGSGIPPADLPLVFKSHYSTKGAKGAGVGLFLCKQIVEAHNGSIEVASQVGHGTTFTIKLPI